VEIINLTNSTVTLYQTSLSEWIPETHEWWIPESLQRTAVLAVLPPYEYSLRPEISGSFTLPLGGGLITVETLVQRPESLPPAKPDTFYLVGKETLVPPDREDFLVGGEAARDYYGNFLGYITLQQHKG